MPIPVIETPRLRLRGHQLSDYAALTALWADPAVTRHLGGAGGPEATWWRLPRYAGHWSLVGFGYWMVEEKQTGAPVGDVGFADYRREGLESTHGIPEIGWVLAQRAQG